MASKTLIDVNQVVKNTYNSTKATPNSIDVTKDLLQRLAELTAKTTEFIEKVDGIEPAMNTIYNLRDQMENLENRTITIVSQFQEQIFLKEDQADQIILDLNEEVQRVEDHIDDLLGLAEGFDSIVDEINTLLGIESRVQELEKYITSVENSSSTTIIGPDDDDVDHTASSLNSRSVRSTDARKCVAYPSHSRSSAAISNDSPICAANAAMRGSRSSGISNFTSTSFIFPRFPPARPLDSAGFFRYSLSSLISFALSRGCRRTGRFPFAVLPFPRV